ncbi:hypothetical protein RclHR1_10470006 [Rhizophagus clarus]|uniref:Uncharacterized protein n=1 Tax=Rhizophagus clarus TaxID=94130 RepID=A0A2Z6QG87_9GLOM|nr:hypothetical protein RclHR1_10470006 [Rhizophagus clarus]
MQNNINEWINWIEEAINRKLIKYYEFENFKNIQEVGSEIVNELKLQREVDFHSNIIRFYGITKFESENKIDQKKIICWAIGQFNLGLNYGNGISVKKDLKMAAYWYEKAANNGHLKAMHNLAHLQYIKNMEADGNHQKAFELFEKPAEGNYAQC